MQKVAPSHVGVSLLLALALQTAILELVSFDMRSVEWSHPDVLRVQLSEEKEAVLPDTAEPGPDLSPERTGDVPDEREQVLQEPVVEEELAQAPVPRGSPREPDTQARFTEPSEEISGVSPGGTRSGEYAPVGPVPAPSVPEADQGVPELIPAILHSLSPPVSPTEHVAANTPSLRSVEGAKEPYIPEESLIRNTPDAISEEGLQGGEEEGSGSTGVAPVEEPPPRERDEEIAPREPPETMVPNGPRAKEVADMTGGERVLRPGNRVGESNGPGSPDSSSADPPRKADAVLPDANSVLRDLVGGFQPGEGSPGKPDGAGIEEYAFVWSDSGMPEAVAPTNVPEDPGVTKTNEDSVEETDWNRECQDEKNPETCHLVQEIYLHKDINGKQRNLGRILKLSVSRVADPSEEGGSFYISIYLPLGVDLRPGAVIKVDGGADIPLRYLKCTPEGCRIDVPIDEPLLSAMETGRKLFVGFRPWGGTETNIIPASLNGFAGAVGSLP